ncbi:hypothetical protein C0583_03340 [Candidatus Parcubacteria bacterium]|nr:MAG: hypothetical protein C0583_03340 [Candidatus Parcubacteria bacterium]
MKIKFEKKYLNINPEQFMQREAGYAHIHSHHTNKYSFVRRMTRDHYPRFHVYVKSNDEMIEIDLHLDQKQTSYEGNHAHNAEYEGEQVEQEVARLKGLLNEIYKRQK